MANSSDIIKIGFDYRASLAQFEKETNGVFDGISEKAGKQKIVIQLDAKNDKVIEKIKELQKLKLDKFTFEFGDSGIKEQLRTFGQLENKINEIINLSKGIGGNQSPIIDVKNSTVQIDKLQNKLDELTKKYDELSSKKIGTNVSGKDVSLVDNEEFKKLSQDVQNTKDEITALKENVKSLFQDMINDENVVDRMDQDFMQMSLTVDNLTDKIRILQEELGNISSGNKSNISSENSIRSILPSDSEFKNVISNLDLTKSKLGEIVKITRQAHADKDGKFYESFTLTDRNGSTETYGESSKTSKGQLLNYKYVEQNAKAAEQEAKALNQAWEEANKVNNALNETKNTLSSLPRMTELDTQFTSLDAKLSSLNSELTSGKISVADYKKEVKSLTSEYSKLVTIQQDRDVEVYKQNAKVAEQEAKQVKDLSDTLKTYQDKVSAMSYKPDAEHRFPEYQAQLTKINAAITDYENHINSLKGKGVIDKSDITKAEELEDTIKSLLNETKKFSSGDKGFTALGADKALEKINSILQQNSAMSRQAKLQIKAYYNEILNGNPTRPLNEILDSVYKIVQAERLAGREGKSFLETLKDKAWYGWAAQLAGTFGVYDVINVFRQGATAVKEFEDGLTKISYTMDMTKSQLDDLGESVLGLASDMKSSVDDAMNVAQIYANMQTSAEEIQKLSEPTLILSNLSGFDSSTIADDIQAVTQQFDMLAEDSMHIADVYDYISRNIAVDYSKGLNAMAEGLQVAGSTAKQAGLSYEQTASIIAKAVEKTRLEGSQVGNGLKTLMTRLSKVGKLSDEVDNETLSQASESLKKVGIEVYNLDGSYREFDVIMGELANKWSDLTDAEKSNISFNIAATRQTNLLSAVLSNFSDSMQLAEEATNANGSALENQQKYMESFSGSLQSLETEAKIAWINILDSDTLKSGIDLLTGLVKVVGELVDKFGLLGTAGIGLSTGLAFKNVGINTLVAC